MKVFVAYVIFSLVKTLCAESTPLNADPRKHKNFHLLPKNCGLQEVDERVLGEEAEAQLEEFPWMALVEFNWTYTSRNNSFLCGGTLINSQYILTSAHCVYSYTQLKEPFSVRLGDHDLRSEIDCRNKIEGNQNYELCVDAYGDIPIDRIIRHSQHRHEKNNIALMRLVKPVVISSSIRPICLPINGEESRPGKELFVGGWGDSQYKYKGSNVKLKAQLPIVSLDKCKEIFSFNKIQINITEEHLCAGGKGNVDICNGDSGNALVIPKEGSVPSQWYMEGIVIFGHRDCGVKGYPTVFTRVSSYINWILDNIEE